MGPVVHFQEQDAVGNSKATSFRSLTCQVKVRASGAGSLAVYMKKGKLSMLGGYRHERQKGGSGWEGRWGYKVLNNFPRSGTM